MQNSGLRHQSFHFISFPFPRSQHDEQRRPGHQLHDVAVGCDVVPGRGGGVGVPEPHRRRAHVPGEPAPRGVRRVQLLPALVPRRQVPEQGEQRVCLFVCLLVVRVIGGLFFRIQLL